MQPPVMRDRFAMRAEQEVSVSLEYIASEINLPLSLIKEQAEQLARELRSTEADPRDISAAEELIESTERMSLLVQALVAFSRGEQS
jgi:signal transduction histidine kinase